jgi:hypothetical protein
MKKPCAALILALAVCAVASAQSIVATLGIGTGRALSENLRASIDAGDLQAASTTSPAGGIGYSHQLLPYLSLYGGLYLRDAGGGTLIPDVPILGDTTTITRATYAYLPVRLVGSIAPGQLEGFRFGISAGPAVLLRAFNNRTTRIILAGIDSDNTTDTPYEEGEGSVAIGGELGVEAGYAIAAGEIMLGIRGYRMLTTMSDRDTDLPENWLYYGGMEISISYAYHLKR